MIDFTKATQEWLKKQNEIHAWLNYLDARNGLKHTPVTVKHLRGYTLTLMRSIEPDE